MNKFPGNNLAPESQPWGRAVENRLRALERGNDTALNRNGNTNAGVLATLNQLSQQITDISNTQADLAAQQSQITALLSDQIKFVASSNSQVIVTLTTTETTYASVSLTVPSGYTKALVVATAMGEGGYWSVSSILHVRPIIGGVSAPYIGHTQLGPANDIGMASVSWSRSISGVSGSISVGTQAYLGNAGSGGSQGIFTTAFAAFTK